MIPRYARPEMVSIWSQEKKFEIWKDIECAVALAMADENLIPQEDANNIVNKAGFDIEEIDNLEKTLKHDVLAFLTSMSRHIGESARFLHQGMTSSDVLDTCLSIQLKQSTILLHEGLERLLKALKKQAFAHKDTICIGRSHGIHAEPITFGFKMAGFYAEFMRNKERLDNAQKEISTASISGAVGTFAHLPPTIEENVAKRLDLTFETHSTQVIPRDRHAVFFSTLGIIASSIERLSVEIRHLQRTELLEAEEYFSKGQKGSSAMPHKRNPVLTENLTGLARIVRSYVIPAMENVSLWHERDISHSSVERFIGPDATITLDFALHRAADVIENLIVYPENMEQNLNLLKGLTHSQNILLALTQQGVSREDAYSMVQKNAMQIWHDRSTCFEDLVKKDPDITTYLTHNDIEKIFSIKNHTKNIDFIFNRIFK